MSYPGQPDIMGNQMRFMGCMNYTAKLAVVLLHLLIFGPATADGLPKLMLPIDCAIGTGCSIQNYFDHDPGPGFRDYACGFLGYDGHDGTDLRLPNLSVMRQGVAVVAAAPGRVRAIRDEMPDASIRDVGKESVRGREAGNAVVLMHGPDWETQYSHLLRGSVRVQPGDWVEPGEVIGLVGLSGNTEFPHLHFEVRYRGDPVDPFIGLRRAAECGEGPEPLWDQQTLNGLSYQPTGLLQAGFAIDAPNRRSVEHGQLLRGSLPSDAKALIFWVEIFGARQGDIESLRVFGPDGRVLVNKRKEIVKNKARWLSYAGKKRRGKAWQPGVYRAVYHLRRGEGDNPLTVIDIDRTIEVK